MLKRIVPKRLKNIIKKTSWKNKYKKYEKIQKKSGQVPYILFSTPTHGNIGDHAIAIAECNFLKDLNIERLFEITGNKVIEAIEYLKTSINKNAVLLITGGGFLGNQWIDEQIRVEKIIQTFPNNKIIIFPQTIYFTDDEKGQKEKDNTIKIFNNHNNLVICAREQKSLTLMKEYFPNNKIIFAPDIVLYLDEYNKNLKREGILLCIRSDVESKITKENKDMIYNCAIRYDKNIKYIDTVINQNISVSERKKVLEDKLDEFASSKFVITDRLHGMIFAAITKTPCVVIGNYNHKVRGVYEWIKGLDYIIYIDSLEELNQNVKELYGRNVKKYETIKKENFYQLKMEIEENNDEK